MAAGQPKARVWNGRDIRPCARPRKGGSFAPARQIGPFAPMTAIRPAILNLERNGIGEVAFLGLGRTDIIPLWFGEGDVVTPDFIRRPALCVFLARFLVS